MEEQAPKLEGPPSGFIVLHYDGRKMRLRHVSIPDTVPIPRRELARALRIYADHIEKAADQLDSSPIIPTTE